MNELNLINIAGYENKSSLEVKTNCYTDFIFSTCPINIEIQAISQSELNTKAFMEIAKDGSTKYDKLEVTFKNSGYPFMIKQVKDYDGTSQEFSFKIQGGSEALTLAETFIELGKLILSWREHFQELDGQVTGDE